MVKLISVDRVDMYRVDTVDKELTYTCSTLYIELTYTCKLITVDRPRRPNNIAIYIYIMVI